MMTSQASTEYRSATGRSVRAYIETETPNLADHTIMSPCYEFVLEVEGFGRVNVDRIEDGLFHERFPREVGGKLTRLMIPASPEAAVIYETYCAEIARRTERALRREREYQEGYNRIVRAMDEHHE